MVLATPALAQSVTSLEGGWFSAGEGGVPQAGLRVATRVLDSVGVDGAVAMVVGAGWRVFVTDLSLSFPTGTDAMFVAPRIGVSVLGGGGAVPAVHAGVGIVARVRHRVGARFDYTYRRLYVGDGWQSVSSITAGVVLFR